VVPVVLMSLLPPAVLLLSARQGVAEEVVHLQARVELLVLLRVQEGPAAAVQLVLLHTDTAVASMLDSGHMLAAADSNHYSHSLGDSSFPQEGMLRMVEPCLAQKSCTTAAAPRVSTAPVQAHAGKQQSLTISYLLQSRNEALYRPPLRYMNKSSAVGSPSEDAAGLQTGLLRTTSDLVRDIIDLA
jgi:hypothetical protein